MSTTGITQGNYNSFRMCVPNNVSNTNKWEQEGTFKTVTDSSIFGSGYAQNSYKVNGANFQTGSKISELEQKWIREQEEMERQENKETAKGSATGAAVGAAAGGLIAAKAIAMGATIGGVGGPVGIAIGAVVGCIAGLAIGFFMSKK